MYTYIPAKSILSPVRQGPDNVFGVRYNANFYRGCQHACIYCDSRSKCYGIEDFSKIQVKENALDMLVCELRAKRTKGVIGFGSMNDPYMPIEKELEIVRQAIKIINQYRFPLHIITKSCLVERDIDLLHESSKTWAAVSITITTADDELAKKIEPGAPPSSLRFATIRKLSEAGIYTGITLCPVLPFITDQRSNIAEIVRLAKETGAKYILGFMGMTLREGQREYFYGQLDKHFSSLRQKYEHTFGNQYQCSVENYHELDLFFRECCSATNIATRMQFNKEQKIVQQKLF
jgi:DNA repair photolyase